MPTLVPRDIDSKFWNALQAEFLGTLLLQVIAASTGSALGVGLTYAVLVYATRHVSGGHLNPALTLATALSGHMHWMKATAYILAQVAGAVVGALLETLLIPGLHLGKNPFRAPGCFYPGHVNGWQIVLWEALLTFAFVYVAYACNITEPGHGNAGPLAVGLAVWALTEAGGKYTGAAINPARLIAPALVFFCTPQRAFWLYLLGQLLGALLGGVVSTGTFGAAAAAPNDDMVPAFLAEEADNRDPLLGPDRVVVERV
jgi:MIP family channel proteins